MFKKRIKNMLKKLIRKYQYTKCVKGIIRCYFWVNRLPKEISSRIQFEKNKKEYIRQYKQISGNPGGEFEIERKYINAQYKDRFDNAGSIDGHYFLQDIYMANKIIQNRPMDEHYDIGSLLNGFIAHLLAADIAVTMIDIRPLPIEIKGMSFVQGNAMDLSGIEDNSIHSLSCLHALEHFGLGRYGDPVNVNGWKDALKAIERVMAPGGILYLSVPIAYRNILFFDAHRSFEPRVICQNLTRMELLSFSYIKNFKIYEINISEYNEKDEYLCGLYIFRKV